MAKRKGRKKSRGRIRIETSIGPGPRLKSKGGVKSPENGFDIDAIIEEQRRGY